MPYVPLAYEWMGLLLPDLNCLLSIPAMTGRFNFYPALPVLLKSSMSGTQHLERTHQGKTKAGKVEAVEYGDDD